MIVILLSVDDSSLKQMLAPLEWYLLAGETFVTSFLPQWSSGSALVVISMTSFWALFTIVFGRNWTFVLLSVDILQLYELICRTFIHAEEHSHKLLPNKNWFWKFGKPSWVSHHMAVKKNKTARYVIKFVNQFAGKYEEKTRIRNIFAQTNAWTIGEAVHFGDHHHAFLVQFISSIRLNMWG